MAKDETAPSGARSPVRSLLLLGAGELGKELAISAQRLGIRVVAADRYEGAPAMQVAHAAEVVALLDGTAIEGVIRTHRPDLIVPEVETIPLEVLANLEAEGFRLAPPAPMIRPLLDREALRTLARELGVRTPASRVVETVVELREACEAMGYPVVVKPRRSSSGRGHSVVTGPSRVERAWDFAREEAPETQGVVVEEQIEFEAEVTLAAFRESDGTVRVLPPVAHRQDRGGYRESWTPAELDPDRAAEARAAASAVVERLGGPGLVGFEFFVTADEVILSEASPGPHDTGLVTLVSQDLSQFDVHLRALLGLPVPAVRELGPAASAVILADREGEVVGYRGLDRALQIETAQLRIFGKPRAHPLRRMGVALATGATVAEARERALEAAARVQVELR